MSSFWDRVDKINQQKKKEDEEKQKKAQSGTPSSFWDRVDKVNSGEIKVNTSMNDRDVTDWAKGAYDVAQRSVNFLKTDGYKLDDKYGAEIDSYLNNADYVAQYLRANKNNIQNYDKVLSSHYDTVNSLKLLREGIDSSNKYYSQWETEDDFNSALAAQKDYEEKAAYDLEAGKKEIEELEKQKEALFRKYRGILASNQSATTYLTGQNNKSQASGNYIGKIEGEESDVIRQMKDLEDEINQKKQYLNLADRVQYGIKLSSVADPNSENYDPEFNNYTGYVADVNYEFGGKPYFDDETYAYINNPTVTDNRTGGEISARDLLGWNETAMSKNSPYYNGLKVETILDFMTDDEIAIYNYYYNKHGKDAAKEYIEYLSESLNARKAQKDFEKYYEGNKLLELGHSITAGLDQFGSGIANLGNGDDYIPTTYSQYLSSMVREDLADVGLKWYNFKEGEWNDANIFGSSLGQTLYDVGTTTANMAPSILVSAAVDLLNPVAGAWIGATLMGASAAGNAYADALNRGLDKSQAATYGVAIGVSEALLEKALGGISKFGGTSAKITKAVSGIDDALLRWSLRFGGSFASEALEEGLQEILDPIFQNAIFGTDEDVNWSEVAYSALLGGLSAGVFEGNSIRKDINKEQSLKTEYEGKTDALIQEGLESDIDTESYKLAKDYKAKTEGGKSLTGAEIRNILAANQEQIAPKDLKKIQKAAEARLTELGQTKDVQKLAELATKYATGQKLSKADKAFLANNKNGNRVAQELIPENIMSGEYTSEWAEGIGTKQVNKLAYNIKNIVEQMAKPATYKPLTERVGEEEKADVSESGKAMVNGKEISLNKKVEVVDFVRDKKTGKITDIIINADGKQVKASEIDYADDDQAFLFSAVKRIENITPADAQVIIRDYDPSSGISVGEYLNGVDEAYTYGYHGYSEADMKSGLFTTKLSDEKAKGAYELGKLAKKSNKEAKSEAIKRMRTAVEAETEKAVAEGKPAPEPKKMAITYNKGNGVVTDFEKTGMKLSKKQRAGVEVAKVLHKLGLGTNFEFFESIYKDGHRVFINDAGVEESAPAGVYSLSDGTIRIDLNAYNGRGLTLYALDHELTHFIQQWSTEKYEVLAEYLVSTYEKTGLTMHQRVLREQARLKGIRGEEISYNEAYDEVVANAMMKMFDDGNLVQKLTELKAKDKNLAMKLWEGFKEILNKLLGVYQSDPGVFNDTKDLMQMKEDFEVLQGMFAEALVDASENFQAAQTIGFDLDAETESVSPAVMRSEQTWTESDYVQQRDNAAKEIAKAIGVSVKKAKDYIDSVNSIAKMIAEDRSRLDYFSSPGRSSFVDNAEYGGSFDFSTLCKKRRLLTGTFTAIQKALPNTALTANEILDIRNRMKEAGLEVSCGLCYVEGSRANMGQFAKEFLRLYKQHYPDAWQPNMADVNTPDGIEWVRINHPECYEQYEYFWNHYGTLKDGDKNLFASQQKPKLYQLHTEYKGEILNKFKNDDKVEDKNLNGGIRLQSFSDFEIVHLIDTMQIIMDMSRVGLAGQAYTKVPDFAWALGDTGLKINLSLIAKGVDENGKLIFDDVEGMPIADAMKLRDRYSKNVGTILVAFNDAQLLAAMADERVDFIIPFHRSQWKKSQYEAMGLPAKTKDYTFMQNEKLIKPTYHEYRGRMVKDKATNYMPNEYWDFSKSGKENAEAYLEMCARNNKRPKFYKLLTDNGNGSYSLKADGSTDGYWKLLIDFKMYDNDGNGSPQMAVKPDFNMQEATRMLNDYSGGHSNFPVAQGIVDSFVKDYKDSHKGEQYSSQETDADVPDSISVNDVVTMGNGRLAVNINSKESGLVAHKKGEWPAVIAMQIRATLAGKSIYAADGDIITITNRGAREIAYGTDSKNLRKEAKETGDYSEVERKMFTAEHAASIIALSTYKSWSANTEDPTDGFKRDGLNHRDVNLYIDGELYTATVLTALSLNKTDVFSYGEKFYDIVSIEKQTNQSATSGDTNMAPIPHKIRFADDSSDRLTIAQKQRFVNRQNAAYSTGDTDTKTTMAEAFSRAKELRSTQETDNISNRDMLANAFETLAQNSEEYKMIQKYKNHIRLLNEYEDKLSKLNAEIYKMTFGNDGNRDSKKLRELRAKAKEIAGNINRHDKELLNLEASEPLRKVIQQERKKEAQKTREHIGEIMQNKKVRAEQTEYRHKIRKVVRDLNKILKNGNKKQNVKEDMKGFVSKALELADYLFQDHVSNDDLIRKGITVPMRGNEAQLVKETEEILNKLYDEADSLTDEEFTRLDAKRKRNLEKLRDLLTEQRNERLRTPVYKLFDDLVTEYASLKNSNQESVKAAYDPNIERFLRSYIGETDGETDSDRKTLLQNMRVADMTTDELWKLYNAYTMVLKSVRDANKLHVKGRTESIDQMVTQIVTDFEKRNIPDKKLAIVARNISNKIGWDYEKLYYALDRIGSNAFTELIMNLANSENIVMRDVIEAAEFRDQIVEKYGFNNWDVNKEIDREFLDNTGKKFKLTLGQLMSLYAYSRRDGAWDHIEYGGFVFGEKALTNPKPADSYKLSKEQCMAITNTLTKEQKAYVEDMQKFLSETMGAKGNEVSMELYGIKMFNEKNYFPIHIAGEFKAQAQESQAKAAAGFGSMSNAGFTHAQNPNAKAPFVLEGFNEVWADHVNEMSRYHGTVPALEDLRRVMNRSFYSDSSMESMSVKVAMENAFGKEAVDYFDNLYREANSGAIRDKLEEKTRKRLSLFRKNSVAYKASVLVQQPTSIIRAYSMIDKKYFGFHGLGTITSGVVKTVADKLKWTNAQTNAYNEMLKYAPGVTMAKDIGGFDTATGGSIRSYLLDTGKSFKQKMKTENLKGKGKAVMDLVDDNAIANLPNVADKIAWIEIWNACKRETAANHKDLATSSDEFMQIVGERFTEVIRATQVYDSIFSKSPMLKSKHGVVQYLVSFMSEPNTVANMAESAVRDAIRGDWKSGAKKAVVIVYAALVADLVKSIIYAMDDDDEDETYAEKYIEALVGSLVNDFNPLSYIPFVRDISSALQGYDIERPDMAIIVDAIEALQTRHNYANKDTENMTEAQIAELEKNLDTATWNVVYSVASLLRIPVKNIRKDVLGIYNTVFNKAEMDTTMLSLTHTFEEALNDSKYFFLRDESKSKSDKLYEAIINGDTAYVDRMKDTYKTDDSYHNAVRKALRENDPRIKEAALAEINGNPSERVRIARLIIADGFVQDDVVMAINSEINALKSDDSSDSGTAKKKGFYTTENLVREFVNGDTTSAKTAKSDIISTAIANGKTKEQAEKNFMSNVSSSAKKAYEDGWLTESKAKKLLVEYAGEDEEGAASKVNYWTLSKLYPKYKDLLNESRTENYYEYVKPAGISMDTYAKFLTKTKDLADIKDANGKVKLSKQDQVIDVIDALPITRRQKKALYKAAGYKGEWPK